MEKQDKGPKNPLNASPAKIDNFMVETNFYGVIDKEELVKNFKLDLDYSKSRSWFSY